MGDQDFLQHQTGTAQPQTRPSLLLGRYRVMKPGEAGGFGTVLTCWDTRLQRRVAIKRIPLMGQGGGAAAMAGLAGCLLGGWASIALREVATCAES